MKKNVKDKIIRRLGPFVMIPRKTIALLWYDIIKKCVTLTKYDLTGINLNVLLNLAGWWSEVIAGREYQKRFLQ